MHTLIRKKGSNEEENINNYINNNRDRINNDKL